MVFYPEFVCCFVQTEEHRKTSSGKLTGIKRADILFVNFIHHFAEHEMRRAVRNHVARPDFRSVVQNDARNALIFAKGCVDIQSLLVNDAVQYGALGLKRMALGAGRKRPNDKTAEKYIRPIKEALKQKGFDESGRLVAD